MTTTLTGTCYYCTQQHETREFRDDDGKHAICVGCLRAWANTDTDAEWHEARQALNYSAQHAWLRELHADAE